MKESEMAQAFVDIHGEIQSTLGHDPSEISSATCPLTNLPGFRSQLIPNAVRMVARRLGINLPKGFKVKNIYVSPDGKRKLTIAEIATRFGTLVAKEALAA